MKFLDCVTLNPKISLRKGEIYPFVEMSNVSTCARLPEKIDHKRFTTGVKFQKGDTVVARITPCLQNGKSFFCKNMEEGFGSTEYLVFRPKNKTVDDFFLYYFMRTEFIRKSMINSMTGATGRQRVNNDVFNDLEVDFPSIEKQKKIASILSAYDDLIENNQKQIRLLEEAAERLYREWFVALRFPGHETTPVTDGVPEGWEKGILGDIARFKRGKTITKAETRKGNVPVVAGGLAPAYYHDKANTVAPVVTVSGSGANAGFARLYNVDVFASDCSFVDIQTTPYLYFVYCFIKDNKESFEAMQKGAAQPHVYAKDINALELYIPPKSIMIDFCKFVSVYFNQVRNLERQIDVASEARDRLLPKLMSGEIEV